MGRHMGYVFIFASVCFLVWLCSFSKVQASPVPAGAGNSINSGASPNQQTGQSENQPRPSGRKNERQKIPKLERNRLEEGKKSAPVRKRKKNKTKTAKKKREVNLSSDDGTSHIANKRKKVKKINVAAERVDDIPLLIKAMVKMGIQEAIDQYIPVQKNQRDLSWGWTAVVWLAYMLSEGDHRKVVVQEYVSGMRHALIELTGLIISENDFTDDRLANLARYLSDNGIWRKVEERISGNTIEAYELLAETVRVDATTVSGYHETVEGGIFQFGVSKDDPNRPQIKIMTGSLDPLGMPLATDVVPGQMADDKLYAPIISRIHSMLQKQGVLYVGDCKLSSLENRLHIKGKSGGHYLCPLPNTGKTPEHMEKWIDEGNFKDKEKTLINYIVQDDKGQEKLKAKGYEIERNQSGEINGKELKWKERVLIVKSPAYEKQKNLGLERRLKNAEEKLYALTPPRGPGKRQIKEEEKLIESAEGILKKHRVEDFFNYEYVREVESKTKYVGKGRGSNKREKKVEEKIRYQITKVIRIKESIDAEKKKYGWKAYVTDVSKERLGFIDIVRSYRKQYRVERIFNRLKSRLNIAPFYVKREDQVKGITHLLMIGVRVITLVEFVVRRSLARSDEKLVGLHLGNPKKATSNPTCEKLLNAFRKITLTIIETGDSVIKHLTPLSQLQREILKHFGLSTSIYDSLEVMR